MSESLIFVDRSKLSPRYVPEELLHREMQVGQITHAFSDATSDPEKFPLAILQVIGPAGFGKTSTVIRASRIIEEQFAKNRLTLKVAYVNLKLQGGNKFAIYRFLLERLAPELPAQGLSAEEMLRYLLKYLRDGKQYALIIMDEIDYLINTSKDPNIVYDLCRLNEFEPEKACNVKGVVFIARSSDFRGRLDPAELSSLGRMSLDFPAYTVQQASDILESRCREAFMKNAIGSDVIDDVASITISEQVGGDVRYALDLLLYAGNLAESQGTGRITLDHIRKVHGQIHPSITSEDIEQLSRSHLLSLIALVRALRAKKKPYVELRDVRLHAAELANQFGARRFEVEEYLDDLKARKLVDIKSLGEIGLHVTSLVELEPALMDRVRAEKQ